MPPTPYRFVNALLLGMLVALLAVMVKGLLIGIEQSDAGWGWLSVPIDTVAAPLLLVPDVLMLRSRQFDKLVVLPWAIWGLLIGTVLGFFNDRD